jgi:hypothetical protein
VYWDGVIADTTPAGGGPQYVPDQNPDGNGMIYCPADITFDGRVDSQDFFEFLPLFFDFDGRADYNGDEAVTSQDWFDFLQAFFAGCP